MIRKLYLTNRFFWLFGLLAILFALSFFAPWAFPAVQTLFVLAMVLVLADGVLLFRSSTVLDAHRKVPRVMSLGDDNLIHIHLVNQSPIALEAEVIDELPFQFQRRDFGETLTLSPAEEVKMSYGLRPLERGRYAFGKVNLFLSTRIGMLQKRQSVDADEEVPVYPSILQMKQYELRAFDRLSTFQGIKRLRRIGHSYEFEQIKNYVRGDDYRSINWKASSRRSSLMVNQYEDERAQQVYCVIDKSRVMRMPFEGLSLLDYAVNTSLVMSNIALRKHDRAGLITFSDKMGATIKADSRPAHLNKILQALYKEKERNLEANYELLFHATRKLISGRSLLLLFTNFESMYALERVLPVLRKVNRTHLLVVVFFENTEIRAFTEKVAEDMLEIYQQTTAMKFLEEKMQMVQKLRQYGIQSVLTKPEDLSVNTINKYLELKARGLI